MVKILTSLESEEIVKAVACAEEKTSAEIATVILPISDNYISEMMFYGFILGSVLDFILWEVLGLTHFPQLFLIQLICMFLFPFLPGMKLLFLNFLPKKLLFHRAVHLGAEELLAVTQQLPPTTPVVLLFISLAEHYVHLFPNAVVKNKIADTEWNDIVGNFTSKLKQENLTIACVETVTKIGEVLSTYFPDNAGNNLYCDRISPLKK